MFAYQQYGVMPDVMTCAKALGCGVPVGAFLASEKVECVLEAGDHGTTYGGNPFACAAVSKVFDLYEEEKLVDHVKETAPYLEQVLDEMAASYECITERRGKGFMQGLEFNCPVGDIIKNAMDKGVILISAGTNVIRFVPPLVVTKEHIDEMAGVLKEVLQDMNKK